MNINHNFIEGEDFEITEDGKIVMTAKYLSKRGRCCSSGCTNCPYEFNSQNKIDPNILGGVIIKIGSTMIDSSIKTKLEKYRFSMKGDR